MGRKKDIYEYDCLCPNCNNTIHVIFPYGMEGADYTCSVCGSTGYAEMDVNPEMDPDLYPDDDPEYVSEEEAWADPSNMPACCVSCGGPYPSCTTSCKIFDD